MAAVKWRRVRTGVVVAATVALSATVVDRCLLLPWTPEQARAALAARDPGLAAAPLVPTQRGVRIGDYDCDLAARKWESRPSPLEVGMVCPEGRFERPWFGRWRAVETARWAIVCVLRR